MSPAATSAQSELGDPISLTMAAAARDEGSSGFNLSATQARAAAHLFPFGPLLLSSSTSSAPSSFTGSSSSTAESATPAKVDLHDLINIMNAAELNLEEEISIRRAFNAKHQNFKVADIGDYLEGHSYTFEEIRYILKIIYRKIGQHKELMDFLIKEDMLHGCTSEQELNNNPVLARVETKVDGTIRRLDKHTVDLENLSKFMHNEKRKRTLSRVVAFIWKIFGVSWASDWQEVYKFEGVSGG